MAKGGGLSRAPAPTFDCYGLLCRKIATLGALFYFMLAIYFGLLCSFLIPHSSFLTPNSSLKSLYVGLSIILDTIIKKFDRRKPFEGTHRTVVCST